tara:strand:+ start:415 stop:1752 length:1338 start_codon:yes stop_codon:yes gene_type:complete
MKIYNKLFNYLNVIISLLFLTYIFYKSEIIFEGNKREYYIKYYILGFLYIIFSILILKLNKTINDLFNLSVISIVISLYTFEFYLIKKKDDQNPNLDIKKESYKTISGKDWDVRSPYQVYRDLLVLNPDVVPYFYPSELILKENIRIHSLSGVSNSLTVFCNENGYFSVNLSDRYGFNNPDNEWDNNIIDYVFVGDSFTHGYCVNRPNDIPSVIRNVHNKKVLNLGYGRNGPLKEYATLREYLPKNVKKIVFMYFEGNDVNDLDNELKNNILTKYITDEDFNQNLKQKHKFIDYEKRKNILIISEGDKFKFLKLRKTRKVIKKTINLKKNKKNLDFNKNYHLEKLEQILFLSKKLAIERKSDFYFVYLPSTKYYFLNKKFPDKSFYFNEISSIVNKLDINFIDIHKEVFEKEKDPKKLFPFDLGGHYDIRGYKKVAETIYKFTKD